MYVFYFSMQPHNAFSHIAVFLFRLGVILAVGIKPDGMKRAEVSLDASVVVVDRLNSSLISV